MLASWPTLAAAEPQSGSHNDGATPRQETWKAVAEQDGTTPGHGAPGHRPVGSLPGGVLSQLSASQSHGASGQPGRCQAGGLPNGVVPCLEPCRLPICLDSVDTTMECHYCVKSRHVWVPHSQTASGQSMWLLLGHFQKPQRRSPICYLRPVCLRPDLRSAPPSTVTTQGRAG